MSDKDTNLQAAVAFVNGVRQEYDLPAVTELEPGKPCRASQCPLSNSVGLSALTNPDFLDIFLDGRIFPLDRPTAEFVNDFDYGQYPELIEDD